MTPDAKRDRPRSSGRRSLLLLAGGLAGIVGALVGVPVIGLFVAPLLRPKEQTEEQWISLGSLDSFPEQQVTSRSYTYRHQDGWYAAERSRLVAVKRDKGEELMVLSMTCTHLGCGVRWESDTQRFICPCHNGAFDAQGNVVAPPPEKPLAHVPFRINSKTHELEVKEV